MVVSYREKGEKTQGTKRRGSEKGGEDENLIRILNAFEFSGENIPGCHGFPSLERRELGAAALASDAKREQNVLLYSTTIRILSHPTSHAKLVLQRKSKGVEPLLSLVGGIG